MKQLLIILILFTSCRSQYPRMAEFDRSLCQDDSVILTAEEYLYCQESQRNYKGIKFKNKK